MRENTPPKLYKYRGGCLDRDLKALREDYFWAASPSDLNDPFEVTVVLGEDQFRTIDLFTSTRRTGTPTSHGDRFLALLRNFVEEIRGWGIYSLSRTYIDELSWAHYADSHRGFCIEYSSVRLLQERFRAELVLEVTYQDQPTVIGLNHVLDDAAINDTLLQALVATKSRAWQHEQEWRIVTGTPGQKEYDFRAVTAIYFGYRMPEDQRDAMRSALSGRGLTFYQMEPIPHSYALRAVTLPSSANDLVTYRYRISAVEDGVPHLDSYLRDRPDFVELLHKAIEVVRREPYCKKVIDAYESGSQSTPEEPVFYVSCEGEDGVPTNYHLSRTEIERRFAQITDLGPAPDGWRRR